MSNTSRTQVSLLHEILRATCFYCRVTRFEEVFALIARKVTSCETCCRPWLFLNCLEIGCGELAHLRSDLLLIDIMGTLELPWSRF